MKSGVCRLCNQYGELTFEHVPPKISFNRSIRYKSIPFLDYIKADQLNTLSFKFRISQGGIGFHSLCAKCNTMLGLNYVSAYHTFVRIAGYIVKRNTNNYFSVEIKDLEPLKILKQICSMILAINDENFFIENQDLVDFVTDVNSQNLPKRYRVFVYLNTDGHFRYLPIMVSGSFNSNLSIICSEITFPPIGLVMTIDYDGPLALTEITSFSSYEISEKRNLKMEFLRLPTYSPFPLDYLNLESIEQGMKRES